MNENPSPLLLTIKEAADKIRMSQGWIRKAIREGELPAVHFGRSVRIFEEQLRRYCRKFEVDAESVDVSSGDSTDKSVQEKSVGYRP